MASSDFSQQLGTEMVRLTVGTGKKTKELLVHKKLLIKKVPFFYKMFTGPFNEALCQSATFPEDDPLAFKAMIQWVYKNTVTVTLDISGNVHRTCDKLIEIYFFAAKYLLEELADRTLSAIMKFLAVINGIPDWMDLPDYFERSSKGSMLQKFLTQLMAYNFLKHVKADDTVWSTRDFAEAIKKNDDFMVDVLDSMREQSGGRLIDPRKKPFCLFHTHRNPGFCPYGMPYVSADSVTI